MLYLAVGLMAGIYICGALPETAVYAIAAAAVLMLGAMLFFFKRAHIALFVIALIAGMLLSYTARPVRFQNGDYTLRGVVTDVTRDESGTVLIIRSVSLDGKTINKRAELHTRGNDFTIGDVIEADASCYYPRSGSGSYNELHTKLSAGIGCIAKAEEVYVTDRGAAPAESFVIGIRNAIAARIKTVFADDSDLFSTLILGVRTELREERYNAYRTSGTAHLLALSGFHMGIISGAVALLIPKRRRNLRICIVTAVMLVYCTVAAYAPGLVRAAVMTLCYMLADRLERRGDPLSALSVAAVLILVVNPYQLYSVGFLLSFSACFGIALFSGSMKRGIIGKHRSGNRDRKAISYLVSSLSVTLCAMIGTLPFQMRYFKTFTPYALISNLIAVPVFSVIIILGILLTALGFIWPAGASAAALVPRSVSFAVEKLLSFIASLPFANTEFNPPSAFSCAVYLLMLFVFSEYVLRPFSKRKWWGAALLAVFTFSYAASIIWA